jgi:hypothetical protein
MPSDPALKILMPSVPTLKQKFMPSDPALKKNHALWPCPETKVHALWPYPSLYIIDIISSILTIIIPLKAGCRGTRIPELEILAPLLPQNERDRAELALALLCLPNSASRTLLFRSVTVHLTELTVQSPFLVQNWSQCYGTKFKVSKVPP